MHIVALVLPEDVKVRHGTGREDGLLVFEPGASCEDDSLDSAPRAQPKQTQQRDLRLAPSGAPRAQAPPVAPSQPSEAVALPSQQAEASVGGKTLAEWEREQSQFADLPKIPPEWLRIRSKSTGEVYFYNKNTRESTFDLPKFPLPPGW